jgi:hypothetical protein
MGFKAYLLPRMVASDQLLPDSPFGIGDLLHLIVCEQLGLIGMMG